MAAVNSDRSRRLYNSDRLSSSEARVVSVCHPLSVAKRESPANLAVSQHKLLRRRLRLDSCGPNFNNYGLWHMLNGRSVAGHIAFLLQAAAELRALATRDPSFQQRLMDFADTVERTDEDCWPEGPGFL